MSKLTKGIEIVKKSGLRLTPQREEILRLFHSSHDSMSVQEVHQKIQRYQASISLDTVYRNLGTLAHLGLLERVNTDGTELRYRVQDTSHHSHQAVCIQCQRHIEVKMCPMNENFYAFLKEHKFHITNHTLEFHGFCYECMPDGSVISSK